MANGDVRPSFAVRREFVGTSGSWVARTRVETIATDLVETVSVAQAAFAGKADNAKSLPVP
jgi:hypothetical protein